MHTLLLVNKQSLSADAMKALQLSLFLWGLIGAIGYSNIHINQHVDSILQSSLMPRYLRSGVMYPFTFHVESTFVSNRELRADFQKGRMVPPEPPLRRLGDCSSVTEAETRAQQRTAIMCNVSLSDFRAAYKGFTVGEDWHQTNKSIDVEATFLDTVVYFEVLYRVGTPAEMVSWRVAPLNAQVAALSREPDLNSERRQRFDAELKKNLEAAAATFFNGWLYVAIRNAFRFEPPLE
ncbi:uncharacterized protein LOC135369419 [Ornithodoros turicata]|uniref:uncharacterized protein LOC135369419 n=1 Tax=Ornithodoros turicata TaxID=34597 RepID=UPI003139B613